MIQVINRAVDIIEYVAQNPNEPKLMGNIAKDLDLNLATCANIVKTLVSRGYLKKGIKEKGYSIGDHLLDISKGIFGFQDLIALADKEMKLACQQLNENCILAILKNNHRVIIHQINGNQVIQATTPEDKEAYDSSTGRLLIAMLGDKELKNFIKNYGTPKKNIWPQADTQEKLLAQIAIIRSNGYALIEDTRQIVGVATPIFKNGKVIASFSVYMPSFRFNENIRKKMIETALAVSQKISS